MAAQHTQDTALAGTGNVEGGEGDDVTTANEWHSGDVTLYLGDCLEVLPMLEAGSVDAVVTDPPYGCNYRLGKPGSRDRWPRAFVDTPIIGDDQPFDPAPWLPFPVVVLFGANHFSDRLPVSRGWIYWDKREKMKPTDFGDGELIWTNQDHVIRCFRHRWRGVIRASQNGERHHHPTEKPIALMAWIVEQYTTPAAIILDPFMGSGTTGVACVQTGRKFIGIEISEEYFRIAQKRIMEAQSQIRIPFESMSQSDDSLHREAVDRQHYLPSLGIGETKTIDGLSPELSDLVSNDEQ